MEIKIGNSAEYLIISCTEIGETKAGDNDFYKVKLQLHINGITTGISAYVMIGELSQFQKDLSKLYDTLKHSFVFASIEDNVELRFTPNATGQIEIKGFVRNSEYTASVDFTIETDQSYLPSTIKQLKEVLTAVESKN
ncbi:WapI family immunity protein [Pontibacter indicus]|uniref:Uncharacterized protein n=1 Tax=Pontibacter indicus TaxID=1317125 RepID=A0A1R3W7W6_9BACT|nr:hypothetical protein [Pontibacter indicus]SIT74016.1 hypothetical protein SAMN05444128_0057 [Pontibacter indicus]